MKSSSWADRYDLCLKENVSIKEIMIIRDCGRPKATEIRDDVHRYCIANNIEFDCKKVPTEVVLMITKHDLDYYYQKMILESKSLNYCGV